LLGPGTEVFIVFADVEVITADAESVAAIEPNAGGKAIAGAKIVADGFVAEEYSGIGIVEPRDSVQRKVGWTIGHQRRQVAAVQLPEQDFSAEPAVAAALFAARIALSAVAI